MLRRTRDDRISRLTRDARLDIDAERARPMPDQQVELLPDLGTAYRIAAKVSKRIAKITILHFLSDRDGSCTCLRRRQHERTQQGASVKVTDLTRTIQERNPCFRGIEGERLLIGTAMNMRMA
jgi:hypothetical protein